MTVGREKKPVNLSVHQGEVCFKNILTLQVKWRVLHLVGRKLFVI